jgi:hypothetical protein
MMYWQAARADSSIETVGRFPTASLFACLQRWSIAFNSGVALGNNRTSIPNSSAKARLLGDLCWVARSSNRTGFHPSNATESSRGMPDGSRWSTVR